MRFAVALAALLLIGCVLFSSPPVTSSLPGDESAADVVPAHDAAGASVDHYGNDVVDAVATYSLDPAGTLYETHSPQTELPRLAPPKS